MGNVEEMSNVELLLAMVTDYRFIAWVGLVVAGFVVMAVVEWFAASDEWPEIDEFSRMLAAIAKRR